MTNFALTIAESSSAGANAQAIAEQIFKEAQTGRVSQQAVRICNENGFELAASSTQALKMLSLAERAKPFHTKKGLALFAALCEMAATIAEHSKGKHAFTAPAWLDTALAEQKEKAEKAAEKKAEKAAEKKVEKAAKKTPQITIMTVEQVKATITTFTDEEKEQLLQYLGETLGYELAFN